MSQVVVTDDIYNKKRSQSLKQEQKIQCDRFKSYKKIPSPNAKRISGIIGYMVLPVLALWIFITTLIGLVFYGVKSIFKLIS